MERASFTFEVFSFSASATILWAYSSASISDFTLPSTILELD
jgi:hypothetical protein